MATDAVRLTRYIGIKARRMKPTLKHRPAIWENMLGTVYAMNDEGEVRYFDYNFAAAIRFAFNFPEGVDHNFWIGYRDARVFKWSTRGTGNPDMPRLGQKVLFVRNIKEEESR
jgi:hypothetical protein